MAGKVPFFLTGANAKIKVNGVTLAFAANLSYNVEIPHFAPKILGVYESDTAEALGYSIRGQFSIIRYLEGSKAKAGDGTVAGVDNSGNGLGNWTKYKSAEMDGLARTVGAPGDDRAWQNLDPSSFSNGTTFDIEVYQKLSNGELSGAFRLRGVRITGVTGSLAKKEVYGQVFSFMAQYFDDDSLMADPSGMGQF